MEQHLHDQVLERLLADDALDALAVNLVDAACSGPEALERALRQDGNPAPREPKPTTTEAAPQPEPPGAYIESISVAGFRGVGAEAKLTLTPGPGLTLVVGRNGSGKSTFAEALEMVLTAESGRWSKARSALWQQGWRNLHASGEVRIGATLVVEGRKPLVLTRTWAASADLDQSNLRLQGAASLDELGWTQALTEFRPFISHPELGVLASEPSRAFDQLHEVLGLGEVTDAVSLLATQRQALEAPTKAVKSQRETLLALSKTLAASDARAASIAAALETRNPSLDALEAEVLADSEGNGADSEHRLLRALANLTLPTAEDWAAAASALRAAATKLAEASAEAAADHSALADLLDATLPFVQAASAPCPVCERPLEPGFATRLRERSEHARKLSARFSQCRRDFEQAQGNIRLQVEKLPADLLAGAERLGLAEGLLARITQLKNALSLEPSALADALETTGSELNELGGRVREAAAARVTTLDETFKPFQRQLAAWLAAARDEQRNARRLKALKIAEKWLQAQEETLRNERFQPLAESVKTVWQQLGQQSSVTLESVQLAGKRTKRHLKLDVSLEGVGSAALGVMSQGELNSLALSLFLPRMTLAQSPFRFLVIDDPVQAMDNIKVDGLARVLREAARKRQVLVFTHDPRLVEAVRRLQIEANVYEVTRRARSAVELRTTLDAAEQYLSDARHVASKDSAMGATLVRRVVPGFCRSAIEAACLAVVRRRRLGRGDRHDEVEEQLAQAGGVLDLVALALFDDAAKAADVLSYFNRLRLSEFADTLKAVKTGAHGAFNGDPYRLVRVTEDLTKHLAARS